MSAARIIYPALSGRDRRHYASEIHKAAAIADAVHGGLELLEVQCRRCNHTELVDLALVIWPREKPVHTLRGVMYCGPCMRERGKKRRPDLVGLRARETPEPKSPPAAAGTNRSKRA